MFKNPEVSLMVTPGVSAFWSVLFLLLSAVRRYEAFCSRVGNNFFSSPAFWPRTSQSLYLLHNPALSLIPVGMYIICNRCSLCANKLCSHRPSRNMQSGDEVTKLYWATESSTVRLPLLFRHTNPCTREQTFETLCRGGAYLAGR